MYGWVSSALDDFRQSSRICVDFCISGAKKGWKSQKSYFTFLAFLPPLYRYFRLSHALQTIHLEHIYRLVSKIINFMPCGSVLGRFCVQCKNFVASASKFYRNSTEILPKFYRNSIEILPKFYWNSIEFLLKLYRISIEILLKLYRYSIQILLKFYWKAVEILLKFYRISIEILSKFYWNSIKNILKFYWNSIQILLKS